MHPFALAQDRSWHTAESWPEAPGRVRTFYGADFVKGVPQGSYPFSYPSVSLFDRGSGFFAPIHTPSGRRAQERSRLGPAHWAATDRLCLDGFEPDGILVVVGMTTS